MANQGKMLPVLTVGAIKAAPVEVPLNFVLGAGQQAMRQVQLPLIDVETEEGFTLRHHLFCYRPAAQPAIMSLLAEVEATVKGARADLPLPRICRLGQPAVAPLVIQDGHAIIPRRPSNGIEWNTEAVERYRLR